MRLMVRHWLPMMLLVPLLAACTPSQFYDSVSESPQSTDRNAAVTYRFTVRVPNAEIETIQQGHLAECAKLGCSVLGTSVDRASAGRATARASVRIKPESFGAFAAKLAAAPAQIITRSRSTEDLAAPIFDAERRLGVKTVVRDRLTAMLHDQSAKTAADLVTIEKELAQAQADIEAVTAQRDTLRTRTDTVKIEINYVGVASVADLTPIRQAINTVGETVVGSISTLITTVVAIVPWLPVIALIWWAARRGMRRWRSRKLPA